MRPEKTEKEIVALNQAVGALISKYGHRILHLHREDGIQETIWAVCADGVSAHRYASASSYNEVLEMRLLNRPLKFGDLDWGDPVICRTNYNMTPYCYEFENKKLEGTRTEPDDQDKWYGCY